MFHPPNSTELQQRKELRGRLRSYSNLDTALAAIEGRGKPHLRLSTSSKLQPRRNIRYAQQLLASSGGLFVRDTEVVAVMTLDENMFALEVETTQLGTLEGPLEDSGFQQWLSKMVSSTFDLFLMANPDRRIKTSVVDDKAFEVAKEGTSFFAELIGNSKRGDIWAVTEEE